MPIYTTVGSVRKVDWSRFQPNFFVVFPAGVLEDAPSFNVLVTRAPDPAASARLQADVVQKYPGVSAIDLRLVVETIQGIVDKATTAVRFLSIFTVGTGLLVLAAAIFTGRYERVKEGVLLRTLGASRRQIFRVLIVEYLALGTLAALTGIVLAAVGQLGAGGVLLQAAVGAVARCDGGGVGDGHGLDSRHWPVRQPGCVRPPAARNPAWRRVILCTLTTFIDCPSRTAAGQNLCHPERSEA